MTNKNKTATEAPRVIQDHTLKRCESKDIEVLVANSMSNTLSITYSTALGHEKADALKRIVKNCEDAIEVIKKHRV